MVKVKICGLTNLEDARMAVNAGCDAIGFIFYKKSPRYIMPDKALEIVKQLPRQVIKIGVFVNSREKTVRKIARLCRLNMLQFHGDESSSFCLRFKKYKIIKAFRVKKRIPLEEIEKYKTFAYLFDTFVPDKIGGTGKKFDWRLIRHIEGLKRPVFLSGGLNGKNVQEAISTVHPHWLDASSSIEARPGKKDHRKVKEFITAAKR
ncbi:MAG: phosphoribosylanthranilate isomerase [Candidatus Omnitrophota bacterium]